MGDTMSNITLSVDEEVIRKVKKIALDRNTTLTAMVRDYLNALAARDEMARRRAAAELEESFRRLSRRMGPHAWTRQDLHGR